MTRLEVAPLLALALLASGCPTPETVDAGDPSADVRLDAGLDATRDVTEVRDAPIDVAPPDGGERTDVNESDAPGDAPAPADVPSSMDALVDVAAPSDVPLDTPVPLDVPADVPADVPTDVPTDVPADVPPDVPCTPISGFVDGDGDTYGAGASMNLCAESGAVLVPLGGDCNDGDPSVHPGIVDSACDGVDADCDTTADAAEATTQATCRWGRCVAFGGGARCDVPIDVEAGWYHTCARLETSGDLYCWGLNDVAQAGGAAGADRTIPFLTSYTGVIDHCAMGTATCVLTAGRVTCFGASAISSATVPFTAALTAPVQIACGSNHFCVRTASGAVQCAGANAGGQAGVDPMVTTVVSSLSSITLPVSAAGVTAGSNFSCAVLSDGTIHCWGADSGILGRGPRTVALDHVPAPVEWTGPAFVEVSAMNFAACARTASAVACWGFTGQQQVIGLTTPAFITAPTLVAPTFASLHGAAALHACALAADGSIACWGQTSTFAMARSPRVMTVSSATPAPALPLAGPAPLLASDLAIGDANDPPGRGRGGHTCAIERSTRRLYCWGSNNHGQCARPVAATLADAVEVLP